MLHSAQFISVDKINENLKNYTYRVYAVDICAQVTKKY